MTAERHVGGECTVGVDIGTTSVKAVAVDARGAVVARARVPHAVGTPAVDRLEHDAARAWRRGPRRALAEVSGQLEGPPAGVVVTAMVPSITAVDRRGVPRLPGLLYGDERAASGSGGDDPDARRAEYNGEREEGARMVAWAARERPDAAGYWPSQAVATHALCGIGAIDSTAAVIFGSLVPAGRWDRDALAALGVDRSRVPRIVPLGSPAGTVPGSPTVVGGGSIDAFCEQIVAGAGQPGDVLVIFGATLIVWVVSDRWTEVPGITIFPSMTPGCCMIGGPSNAGGLFVDWVRTLVGAPDPRRARRGATPPPAPDGRPGSPTDVPVWLPYLRGERTPFYDPHLRASLHGLDITHGPDAVVRAAHEASGFVVRRIIERSGVEARRIVATGGGSRSAAWMEAVADTTGLPVETVGVPEGAALGAAFLARMAAGLETDLGAAASWASRGRSYAPDPAWAAGASARYRTFEEVGPAG
jgi:xylulokinase